MYCKNLKEICSRLQNRSIKGWIVMLNDHDEITESKNREAPSELKEDYRQPSWRSVDGLPYKLIWIHIIGKVQIINELTMCEIYEIWTLLFSPSKDLVPWIVGFNAVKSSNVVILQYCTSGRTSEKSRGHSRVRSLSQNARVVSVMKLRPLPCTTD